jgi:glutamate---cysteine ligase / carboxylate-amine ligase
VKVGDQQRLAPDAQIRFAREAFEDGDDFTIAVEEEFALLDPDTLELTSRFEELKAGAAGTELDEHLVGELIASEIEIKTGRCENFSEVAERMAERRAQLEELADRYAVGLASTGTHPWSRWQDQRIIDTPHYRRNKELLQYVVWRNNSFGIHAHIGIRGADRAIAVCDRLRGVLPQLLAISANSPFLDGYDSGLHSARSQIFTKSFPRCGIPEDFGDWRTYADHVDFLIRTNSISEHTQLWWSVRPHHAFGTVEVRICDAQTTAEAATALEALAVACVAQTALDIDEGVPHESPPPRLVEETFWRAIRSGLDGRTIDLGSLEEYPAAAIPDRLMGWSAPARAALGIEPEIAERNGAQRQRDALAGGAPIEEVFAAEVAATRRSYAGEGVTT